MSNPQERCKGAPRGGQASDGERASMRASWRTVVASWEPVLHQVPFILFTLLQVSAQRKNAMHLCPTDLSVF